MLLTKSVQILENYDFTNVFADFLMFPNVAIFLKGDRPVHKLIKLFTSVNWEFS